MLAAAIASTACEVRAGEGGLSFDVWHGSAQDTWERTYTVAPGGRLEILNVNGEIRAEAATGGTVHVRAERRVTAASDQAAQEMLGKLELREEVGPQRVRVETVVPRGRWGGHKVTYTVQVPPGVHVDLRTVNGGVRLDNVGGEVRATATNGGVRGRLADVSLLDARTTNGGVELELTGDLAPAGRVSLASVNGGVRLAVPEATRGNLDGPLHQRAGVGVRPAVRGRRRPDPSPCRRPAERRRRPHRPADHQRRRHHPPVLERVQSPQRRAARQSRLPAELTLAQRRGAVNGSARPASARRPMNQRASSRGCGRRARR